MRAWEHTEAGDAIATGTVSPRSGAHPLAVIAGWSGIVASLGSAMWMVLAAAERPSVLSPPSLRTTPPPSWLLQPLHGLLPSLTRDPLRLRDDYLIALAVLFGGWLLTTAGARALPRRTIVTTIVVAQVLLVLGPPQQLTDVFNYVVYGGMAAAGHNPHVLTPAAAAAHDTAYALSNWHDLPSPYGPLLTILFVPLSRLGLAAEYAIWKLIVLGCSLGTLALVWWIAGRTGVSRRRAIAFAGLCPVVLVVGLGGLHNDGLPVLATLGAVACLLRGGDDDAGPGWDLAAGALAIVAAGFKLPLAIVAPTVVLGARRRPVAAAGAVATLVVLVAVTVILFGTRMPALALQSRLVTPLSVPNLLGLAAGHGGADATVRTIGAEALVVAAIVAAALTAWRRRLAPSAIAVVLLLSVVAVSWVMPWYLGWSLPLIAAGRPRHLLAPVVVVACAWLVIGAGPLMPKLIHAAGYYPTRTATGRQNHLFEQRLVR